MATLLQPGTNVRVLRTLADCLKDDSQGVLVVDLNALDLENGVAKTVAQFRARADNNPPIREAEMRISILNEQKKL